MIQLVHNVSTNVWICMPTNTLFSQHILLHCQFSHSAFVTCFQFLWISCFKISVIMKRFKKTFNDHHQVSSYFDLYDNVPKSSDDSKWSVLHHPMKILGFVVVFLMLLTILFIIGNLPSDSLRTFAEASILYFKPPKAIVPEDDIPQTVTVPKDKLLGGLLPSGFNETSCVSRYESLLYSKGLRHKPSSYLISRLRRYEALHKQCGPYTELYNKTVELIKFGDDHYSGSSVCNYVIWLSFSGLGNRILTLTSAFLYSLLTNRVLLVDPTVNLPDLFCEPFPEVSWLLPSDFPILDQFSSFNQKSPHSYGYMVRNNVIGKSTNSRIHPFLYLHLSHDFDDQDKSFFCDTDQTFLKKVPWLIVKSNNYYVPALFLIPSFEQELNNLFPEKETVFHFLGRYLFHPTNSVWGLITRYHQAYLAQADEKIGIQIRVFDLGKGYLKNVLDQILACTRKENLLPQVNMNEPIVKSSGKQKSISVLITSLGPQYFEVIRNMYWENPTVTGEIVSVFQPSHEEYQQTEKLMHDRKAWAEMYLLSLTDKLVTSAWSTFGYVAQGLGGVKPWILYKFENGTVHNPPCFRAISLEPCYHSPPYYDCKKKKGSYNIGTVVPNVRHCEDNSGGLKLFDRNGEL